MDLSNYDVREVLWDLAQKTRELIAEDSGPREESIALSFAVEKAVNEAEVSIRNLSSETVPKVTVLEGFWNVGIDSYYNISFKTKEVASAYAASLPNTPVYTAVRLAVVEDA